MDLDRLDPKTLERLAFRRRRTWAAAILGHALVLLVMVGGPCERGRRRALHAREGFGALAACLWDAEAAPEAGLTLPEGDLAHYADASRTPGWPERCVAHAGAIVPPAVFFVFPSVRQAEADARRAVEVVRRELRAAADAEPGMVPTRPRLAVLRLSAALALLSRAAGDEVAPGTPALVFRAPARTPLPERVPLQIEDSAALEARSRADGVELLALGERGLRWVRVGGGRVDLRRFRRPAALRGWVRDGATPWLLWWTRPDRCGDDGCARRALGLAPLTDASVTTPVPRWLAAHPLEGSRSVAVRRDVAWVAAVAEGGAELRRFTVPAAEEDADIARPVLADGAWALPGARRVEVAPGVAWWLDEGRLHRTREGDDAVLVEVAAADLRRAGPWVVAWGAREVVVLHGDRVVERRDSASAGVVEVVAGPRGAVVVAESAGRLRAFVCEVGGCGPWLDVAPRAWAWDVAPTEGGALVAWTTGEDHPIAARDVGPALGPRMYPGPCFDTDPLSGEPSGMCGAPTLAASGDRVFVVARERQDAWIVEREGGGWRPLRGLR